MPDAPGCDKLVYRVLIVMSVSALPPAPANIDQPSNPEPSDPEPAACRPGWWGVMCSQRCPGISKTAGGVACDGAGACTPEGTCACKHCFAATGVGGTCEPVHGLGCKARVNGTATAEGGATDEAEAGEKERPPANPIILILVAIVCASIGWFCWARERKYFCFKDTGCCAEDKRARFRARFASACCRKDRGERLASDEVSLEEDAAGVVVHA